MRDSRTKNAMYNIIFSIVLQIVVFAKGLILPRIIIPTYGSDVNGLISSVTHFLAYISLLEAGVGSIFRASLYKPLANRDMNGVSGIINEQKRFYKKIGYAFVAYVLVLCAVYPFIAITSIGKPYIISLILILSVNIFAEYFVSLPYASLLAADQKIRISYIVSILYTIASFLISVLGVSLKADIRLIYLSMSIVGLFRPIFYTLYVRKHYKLSKTVKPDETALSQRWNGMVHHFAYSIHTNSASAILTIFIGTALVSVYNVYGAVIFGIEKIITSVSTGTAAGIGNLLVSDTKEQANKALDQFELVQGGITTVMFSITAILLLPFIKIYTVNMTDTNYIQPWFGYLLIVAEAIYCFRCIYSTISTSANKFKETQIGAILECAVNVFTSLVFVLLLKQGIAGVAVGMIAGMLCRYAFEVVFLSKNVIFRPIMKALKMLVVSIAVSAVSMVLCNWILDYALVDTFLLWIAYACVTALIVGAIAFATYYLFYMDTIKAVMGRLRWRKM